MRKVELTEQRADRLRRNNELRDARLAMHASGLAEFFIYVSSNYHGRGRLNKGNFDNWPTAIYQGPAVVTRGSFNEIPTRFTAQRALIFTFTDAGVSTTVTIKRQTWQGRKRVERGIPEIEEETNTTRPYEDYDILSHAAILLAEKVMDPAKNRLYNSEPIFAKAKELAQA